MNSTCAMDMQNKTAPNQNDNYPAVSVIIPTYNAAHYILQAIESVFQQSYRDFEIVVVDDGSTDGTETVLQPYTGQLRYIRQENSGAAAARNRAISVSRGKYLGFLDADDRWMPEKLREQVAVLDADHETVLVCSDLTVVSEKGVRLPTFLSDKPNASGNVFDLLMHSCFILTSSVLVRRECALAAGLFDESLPVCEDFDLWLRVAQRGNVQVLSRATVIRRLHGQALSADQSPFNSCRLRVLNKLQSHARDLGPKSRRVLTKELSEAYWNLGYQYFAESRRAEARSNMLKCWTYDWKKIWLLPYLLASFSPVLSEFARSLKHKLRR